MNMIQGSRNFHKLYRKCAGNINNGISEAYVYIRYMDSIPAFFIRISTSATTSNNGSLRIKKRKIAAHIKQALEIDIMDHKKRCLNTQGHDN
ncbi:hypothetical protein AYI69_g1741 [Smittium culicis]|uniref:Uncharacterized protein n=1 Tax=Smittium culicis TaxID=133412 RepID=A0A1R1YPE1_9FUNG|nr:hypothetical protein AYI69_g1741 [Smittium culicis]